MKRSLKPVIYVFVLVLFFAFLTVVANADGAAAAPGQENLSTLTYEELQGLLEDISSAKNTYHTPSKAQKASVLAVTQTAAQQYCAERRLQVTDWAWYDREYTYTKKWDLYTLKTHLDYKDINNKKHKADVYTEVYCQDGVYQVAYLKLGTSVVFDHRADYGNTFWFTQPRSKVNSATNIDLSTYTVEQLDNLSRKAQREIDQNHTASKSVASIVLTATKLELEQYCLRKGIEITSYAWYDNEYTYLRDWDYYSLETHVDYKTGSSSSQQSSKLFSHVCCIDNHYELVYLRLGGDVLFDKRSELSTAYVDGVPKYSWNGAASSNAAATPQIVYVTPEPGPDVTPEPKEKAKSQSASVTPEPGPVVTPQIIYVTPEPGPDVTPQIVYVTPEPVPDVTPEVIYITPEPTPDHGLFSIDLADATDEQLTDAADAIKAEQKSRVVTSIVLDQTAITLTVGKNQKIQAKVVDLPEGEPAPKLTWTTSDKTVAACTNGQIKAVSGGTATVTCTATLSDGTVISESCKVQVNVLVSSVTVDKKNLTLNGGEKATPSFAFKPDSATDTRLSFESSNPKVAAVSADGVIEATGAGKATITAKTMDGSGKSVVLSVNVVSDPPAAPREDDEYVYLNSNYSNLMLAICRNASEWMNLDKMYVGAAAIFVHKDLVTQGLNLTIDTDSWSPAVYVTCDRASETMYFAFLDKNTDKYRWVFYNLRTKSLCYVKEEMKAGKTETTARRLNKGYCKISSYEFDESYRWVSTHYNIK